MLSGAARLLFKVDLKPLVDPCSVVYNLMDASTFYTDKYDEELMISVKTSEECYGPSSLEFIKG